MPDYPDSGVGGFERREQFAAFWAGRTVIYDQKLKVGVRLAKYTLDGFLEICGLLIIDGKDD
jgi:hypothetical protein